jgi:tRNA A-37 threonylcarbamoyl transferase component Bud32
VPQEIAELESSLKDLPRVGTLVKDRGYRQVWRFEVGGKPYYLKFYPRGGFFLKRMLRGNPAMREFTRLIALQKAAVPSPRATAVLSGFRVDQTLGDAVILEGIEPAVQLDHYLSELELGAEAVPHRRELAGQVIDLVRRLSRARLGHSDLHLGNFLLKEGKVYLLDGYAVGTGGLREKDVLLLGHSARRFATTTELLRGWRELTTGEAIPERNPASKRLYRKFLERATRENSYFGKIDDERGWRGHFVKRMKFSRRYSAASGMKFDREQWREAWKDLLARMDADQLTVIKRSASGDVLSGEIVVGGRTIGVIVKRPKKKYWYRHLNSVGRASRVMRMWTKAWKMYIRNIPAEFPLMMMEKRTLGYVTDSVIVIERTPGETLAAMDLDSMSACERERMFQRVGRTLRKLEGLGFAHFDAKATNWIVMRDEKVGATPILIDVDGVRHYSWRGEGIRRLLRSMREHSQYTPGDSLALCRGYGPWARIVREGTTSSEEDGVHRGGAESAEDKTE